MIRAFVCGAHYTIVQSSTGPTESETGNEGARGLEIPALSDNGWGISCPNVECV